MYKISIAAAFFLVACSITSFISCSEKQPSILVFSKTAGFYHSSIVAGNKALLELGAANGIAVDTTTSSEAFREDHLKQYAAVVFLNTTGNVLDQQQEAAFERYIQSGGGFVGIHAATDTEYEWSWYGRLVGGYFESHPEIQTATLNIKDASHPATSSLPLEWKRRDEWYNFKKLNGEVKTLITIDERSYTGGRNGSFHPVSWYHTYDGGRAFYTALGHTDESYTDPIFLRHLLGGIRYAMGVNSEKDHSKALARPLLPYNDISYKEKENSKHTARVSTIKL